jgi:2-polyprenyl-3-methyl-5-hydroxy-6-metoxy-1,4-benzoquinol methylase
VGKLETSSLYDEDSRRRKAEKIITVLRDFLAADLSQLRVLDVGCGSGIIARQISLISKQTFGVDLDLDLLRFAQGHRSIALNLHFFSGDVAKLPCAPDQFDVVICAQVYEHVKDQQALAREVWRILKPGGVCFFSGPNRLAIMEEHYWLPFLSWLPRFLSDGYMRLFRRGRIYDAYPRSYWFIRRLWSRFDAHDMTLKMIRDPGRYSVTEQVHRFGLLRHLPLPVLRVGVWLIPNYNWILVKPEG